MHDDRYEGDTRLLDQRSQQMKKRPVCTNLYKILREIVCIDDSGDEVDYVN